MERTSNHFSKIVDGIPPSKLWGKVKKTLIGGGMVVGAWALIRYGVGPWWVGFLVGVVGAHIASGELIGRTIRGLKPVAKDLAEMIGFFKDAVKK